jgi:hypothetical protein
MNSCKTCLDYKKTFKGKGICKLYDEYVNKVVEQLKEYERYVYDAVSDEDSYVIDTEKAIEIVKGAAKDEDNKTWYETGEAHKKEDLFLIREEAEKALKE